MKQALQRIAKTDFQKTQTDHDNTVASGKLKNTQGLIGNCGGLTGDAQGVSGVVSQLHGDLDACELSDDERKAGVDVNTLAPAEAAANDASAPAAAPAA